MTMGAAIRACAVGWVVSALCFGCMGGTSLTDVWASRPAEGPVRNVLVMGARTDAGARRTIEDGLAYAFAERGVRATPSYTLFPDSYPTTAEAQNVVRSVGYDGLFVATSHGVTEQVNVVPGYGGPFWGGYYWGAGWAGWYPGYVYTDRFVKFETTLWDPRGGGKLVWAANTVTENPSSGTAFVKSLVHKVMPTMEKAGLVPPKGSPERISQLR
jgi:hypothetical protein